MSECAEREQRLWGACRCVRHYSCLSQPNIVTESLADWNQQPTMTTITCTKCSYNIRVTRTEQGQGEGGRCWLTSGLRSLCTTPFWCMKETAETSCWKRALAWASVNPFCCLRRSSNSPPCISSITIYTCSCTEKVCVGNNSYVMDGCEK